MKKRDVKVFLEDILESIEKIEDYTADIDEEEFYGNSPVQDAVLRRHEIIREAVRNNLTILERSILMFLGGRLLV